MSGYTQGRRVEYAVIHDLKRNGYNCIRAASSKGVADVVAFKTGQILLINVKKTEFPGPDERQSLLRLAWWLPGIGVPLVAIGRTPLTYWRLTGVGPKDREPWTPDEVTP